MNKMTLTLKVVSSGTRRDHQYGLDKPFTETLCEITDQHLSPRMLGAALRTLADEIDPRAERGQF